MGIQETRLTDDAQYYDNIYKRKNQSIHSADNLVTDSDDNAGQNKKDNVRASLSQNVKDWKGWLKECNFYIHGGVYMFARLAMNLTMTAIPFYLKYVLKYNNGDEGDTPIQIALVPLCSYF